MSITNLNIMKGDDMRTYSVKKSFYCFRLAVGGLAAMAIVLQLAACSVKLVQPYDEKLLNDTEAFYKKAALMISEGIAVSPRKNEQRAAIAEPTAHPGHFSKFEAQYDSLLVDSDALILRGMAGSAAIDGAGAAIQEKISELIEDKLPSSCPALKDEIGSVSLTVANYVDLKCLILRWRGQHNGEINPELTQGKFILKSANWEGRKLNLFYAVLAIQEAEGFKKEEKK